MIRTRLALLGLLLLGAPIAHATTVLRQSFESLTDRSELVVRGRVERVELRDDPQGPPFRIAYVRVSEQAAGAPETLVPVRLPGGVTRDGLLCAVAGTPVLAEGDETILFLTQVPEAATQRTTIAPPALADQPRGRGVPAGGGQPRKQWQPMGLALGAWRVSGEGDDAVATHDPAASGLGVVGEAQGASLPERVKAKDLLARVRERRGQRR